jgi:hypothetical protein
VLFTVYDIKATVSEEPFEEAVKKLEQGSLDAVFFVGAPVPFIGELGGQFQFVRLPTNPALEQIYLRISLGKKQTLGWRRHGDLRRTPAIMGLDYRDEKYVADAATGSGYFEQSGNAGSQGSSQWKSAIIRHFPYRATSRPTR